MGTDVTPQQLDIYAATAWTWAVTFTPRLVSALVILVAAFFVATWLSRMLRAMLRRSGHVDETVQPVLAAIVRYAILILACVAALGQIGIQTASLLAVLGAAGLAIGLALQGTLTNIAAGIMLLWLRPFRLGDYIEVPAGAISGRVREIGLFVCILENFDGVFVFAPNSAIWNSALRNHSRNAGRLIALTVTLPAAAELDRARKILLGMLQADARVLKAPPPRVFVEGYGAGGALILNCSLWASHGEAGALQRELIEAARHRLVEAGAESLVPLQIIRTVPPDADPSRLAAARTDILTRGV
jgi:small conductance mechanosensitive channel